jgi:ferrous iron transport protein B
VIVAVVAVLGFLNTMGTDGSLGNEDTDRSIVSAIGRAVTPVFSPMGITEENWPASVGLFTGIFAKEAVVGTLDNLYSAMAGESGDEAGEEEFSLSGGIAEAFRAIPEGFSTDGEEAADEDTGTFQVMRGMFHGKAGAYAYLLFILIYAPCVAVIAAIYRETNLRWAVFSTAYLTILAWSVSTLFYRIATFGASPGESALWAGVSAAVLASVWLCLKLLSKRSVLRV